MSTTPELRKEEVECRVCGAATEFDYLASTQQSEPPDLDTRPGEGMRSTLRWWVQRCPSCGYCAPTISEGPAAAARVVKTAAYKALLDNEELPELARRFLCASAVLENGGDRVEALWQTVYAAWACDDEERAETAAICRERAVELLRAARAAGVSIAEQAGEDRVVEADLLRRAGRFDEAIKACEEGLAERRAKAIEGMLVFEQALAMQQDVRRYTTEHAEAWRSTRH